MSPEPGKVTVAGIVRQAASGLLALGRWPRAVTAAGIAAAGIGFSRRDLAAE